MSIDIQPVLDWLANQPTNLLITSVAGILFVGGYVWGTLKYGWTFPRKLLYLLTRYRPHIPRETLRILPMMVDLPTPPNWCMATVGEQPAMQVTSAWRVTNIANETVRIHSACIVRPRKAHTYGMVLVIDPRTNRSGDYAFLPKSSAIVLTHFFVCPPVCKEGEDFRAQIVFSDQFGNEHKTKWVIFKYQ